MSGPRDDLLDDEPRPPADRDYDGYHDVSDGLADSGAFDEDAYPHTHEQDDQ